MCAVNDAFRTVKGAACSLARSPPFQPQGLMVAGYKTMVRMPSGSSYHQRGVSCCVFGIFNMLQGTRRSCPLQVATTCSSWCSIPAIAISNSERSSDFVKQSIKEKAKHCATQMPLNASKHVNTRFEIKIGVSDLVLVVVSVLLSMALVLVAWRLVASCSSS